MSVETASHQAVATIVVAIPFNSQAGFEPKPDRSAPATEISRWRPVADLRIELNPNIFTAARFADYSDSYTINDLVVQQSRLYRLDDHSSFLEIVISAPDILTWDDPRLLAAYKSLVDFQDKATGPVFRWVEQLLGTKASKSYFFTINVVSRWAPGLSPKKLQALIGPTRTSEIFDSAGSSNILAMTVGETGGWIGLSDECTDEQRTQARYWLSQAQSSFSTIQFALEVLIKQLKEISSRKKTRDQRQRVHPVHPDETAGR